MLDNQNAASSYVLRCNFIFPYSLFFTCLEHRSWACSFSYKCLSEAHPKLCYRYISQEVKFLWKHRKRGDCKNEYFGQLKSCPGMLLIFPEGSSGRSVCFCAGGAVPCLALSCAASAAFWRECSTLCSANNVQNCRIRFFSHFKRQNKNRLSHCTGASPPNKSISKPPLTNNLFLRQTCRHPDCSLPTEVSVCWGTYIFYNQSALLKYQALGRETLDILIFWWH